MAQAQLHSLVRHLHRLSGGVEADPSDRQLLERFLRSRDESAFTALVRRHGGLVLGVCWRVLHHSADVEDAFQATFLVLARKAASIPWRESIGGWLHETAYRVACKARGERSLRQIHLARIQTMSRTHGPSETTLHDASALLDEEIRGLPETCRAPLLLCYLEGQTRDQAARRLGWSLRTLGRRLARGLDLLRARLARRGLSLSVALLTAALSQSAAGAVPEALASAAFRGPAAVPPSVAALAESITRGMSTLKLKAAVSLVLALALLLAGVAGIGPGQQKPAEPAEPQAKGPTPKVDRLGDPLPQGAVARLGTVRLRHGYNVAGVAFSPDRKLLASAGQDNSVCLWQVPSGKLVRRLVAHTGIGSDHAWVYTVAFSPDGKRLAAGTGNGASALIVWDTKSGKEIYRISEKQRGINLAWSPDGKRIATADVQGPIFLYAADTGGKIRELKGHGEWVECVAFSADGKLLASGCRDRTARLWDPATGKELRRLRHGNSVTSLAFSPNAGMLVTGTWDGQITVWDLPAGKESHHWSGHSRAAVSCLAFLGDGKTLASGSWDRSIRLWDVANGKQLRILKGHKGPVPGLAISSDDKLLASGSWDRTVRLWDLVTGKEITTHSGHQQGIWSVAFAPDGKTLATGSDDDSVRLWDVTTCKETRTLTGHRGIVDRLHFSADGKTLLSSSWDYFLRRWDVASGKKLGEHLYGGMTLVPSADGKLLAGGMSTGMALVWERATGKQLHKFKSQEGWPVTAFTPDSKRLAAGSDKMDGTVVLWDLTTGKEVRRFQGAPHMAYALAFSPDGQLLAGAMANRREYVPDPVIHLWETATGKELRQLKGHSGTVARLAFSADGRTLASAGERAARLWEVATGRQRRCFEGHVGGVTAVAFSPNARRLASASQDTTALIWDVTGLAGAPPPGTVAAKVVEERWLALSGNDASRAYDAVWWLASVPKQVLPLLAQRLRPVVAADAKVVARLIADLDSKRFAVRKKAAEELVRLGEGAADELRKALDGQPDVETRRRIEELLERQTSLTPAWLQTLRAVEVLEKIGNREARQVLEKLARGMPGARLTREAAAALARLVGRS
jgi:RNA polymerase sigma factor (sigma-70 family)